MSYQPILSVDTSYDPSSDWIGNGRVDLYRRLGPQFAAFRMGPAIAERRRVLRKLHQAEQDGAPFRAIVVSSHGAPSTVYDDDSPDRILIGDTCPEPELRTWARGRALYFCSCETGQGPLLEMLVGVGALMAIGFRGKPSWRSDSGARMWLDFDQQVVTGILYRQGASAIHALRDHFINRIESNIPYALDAYKDDLTNMKETLQSMVILSAAGGGVA